MEATYTRIAAFDLDHTLLKVNSSYHFGAFLYKRGFLSLFSVCCFVVLYFMHKSFIISSKTLHKQIFQYLFYGKAKKEYERLADEFLNSSFKDLLNPCLLDCLESARERGDLVMLLSNGPEFLVKACAQRLLIPFASGTTYAVDSKGCFSHLAHVLKGEDKARILREIAQDLGIERIAITTYSDSILDLPFLETGGVPVAVNPDRYLRKICKKRKWLVL